MESEEGVEAPVEEGSLVCNGLAVPSMDEFQALIRQTNRNTKVLIDLVSFVSLELTRLSEKFDHQIVFPTSLIGFMGAEGGVGDTNMNVELNHQPNEVQNPNPILQDQVLENDERGNGETTHSMEHQQDQDPITSHNENNESSFGGANPQDPRNANRLSTIEEEDLDVEGINPVILEPSPAIVQLLEAEREGMEVRSPDLSLGLVDRQIDLELEDSNDGTFYTTCYSEPVAANEDEVEVEDLPFYTTCYTGPVAANEVGDLLDGFSNLQMKESLGIPNIIEHQDPANQNQNSMEEIPHSSSSQVAKPTSTTSTSKKPKQTRKPKPKCQVCKRIFKNQGNLNVHLKFVHPVQIPSPKCHLCNKVYANLGYLKRHIRNFHNPERRVPVDCPQCKKRFVNLGYLKRHVRNLHNPERRVPVDCPQCKKRFVSKESLRSHSLVHEERKFQCSMCPNNYVTQYRLDNHIKRIHSNRPKFDCDRCTSKFTDNSSLKRHYVSHTDPNRPRFPCDKCEKTYTCRRSMIRHAKVHTQR